MPRSPIALTLIVAGGILIFVGVLVWSGALAWFGRLPGDVRLERQNVRVYFPVTSMVLLSVLVSLVLAIVRRIR